MSQLITVPGMVSLSQWKSDGDTFAFKADDIEAWAKLPIRPRPTPASPWVRVRLDGCDAPELHALTGAQSSAWGRLATERMWEEIGGGAVTWSLVGNIPLNTEELPAQLVVIGLDIFKRVIAWLVPERADATAENSVNLTLVAGGLAYPAVYNTTPAELAELIAPAWQTAIDEDLGFARLDATDQFDMLELATDQDAIMIHPKVWRRIDWFVVNYASLDDFELFQLKWSQLYQPEGSPVYNLRKTMLRAGSEITIDPSPVDALWYAKGQFVTSQIQKFLGALVTLP